MWARVRKLVTEAGGKAIAMYGMRHSFASNLLIAGVSDVKVARGLGHRDMRMLHKHYGHLLSYDADINPLGNRPWALASLIVCEHFCEHHSIVQVFLPVKP